MSFTFRWKASGSPTSEWARSPTWRCKRAPRPRPRRPAGRSGRGRHARHRPRPRALGRVKGGRSPSRRRSWPPVNSRGWKRARRTGSSTTRRRLSPYASAADLSPVQSSALPTLSPRRFVDRADGPRTQPGGTAGRGLSGPSPLHVPAEVPEGGITAPRDAASAGGVGMRASDRRRMSEARASVLGPQEDLRSPRHPGTSLWPASSPAGRTPRCRPGSPGRRRAVVGTGPRVCRGGVEPTGTSLYRPGPGRTGTSLEGELQ
jgi:hypothetical protein